MTHFISQFGPLWGQAHLLSTIQSPETLLYYWDTGSFYGCLIFPWPAVSVLTNPGKSYSPLATLLLVLGFSGGDRGKEPICQCRRHKRCGFDPWVGKIPWRRAWQPTPVFLSGESPRIEEPGELQSMGSQSWTRLKWLSTHAPPSLNSYPFLQQTGRQTTLSYCWCKMRAFLQKWSGLNYWLYHMLTVFEIMKQLTFGYVLF